MDGEMNAKPAAGNLAPERAFARAAACAKYHG